MINSLSRVITQEYKDKICVPLRAKGYSELFSLARAARRHGAKYLEIWLDTLPGVPVIELQNQIEFQKNSFLKPYIAVLKGKKEHGNFHGNERKRLDILLAVALSSADFVDIGIGTDSLLLKKTLKHIFGQKKRSPKNRAKVILSYHNFQKTPRLAELMKICKKGFAMGADIVKIAVMARKYSDNVTLFELTKLMREKGRKVIAISMGEKGALGRIGCLILGSFLTFVSLSPKYKTAPGQLIF